MSFGDFTSEREDAPGEFSFSLEHRQMAAARDRLPFGRGQEPAIELAVRDRHEPIVLAPGAPHEQDLHATLDELIGPGARVDDVWLWDVRPNE